MYAVYILPDYAGNYGMGGTSPDDIVAYFTTIEMAEECKSFLSAKYKRRDFGIEKVEMPPINPDRESWKLL